MAMNVSERFLHNAKNSGLAFRGQPSQVGIQIQIDADLTPFRKSFHVPANRRRKPRLVEQGRVQQMRDGAQFPGQFFHQVKALTARLQRLRAELLSLTLDGRKIHIQGN